MIYRIQIEIRALYIYIYIYIYIYMCVCVCKQCLLLLIIIHIIVVGRSHWPRGLRGGSAAARLLRSWARIPPGAWMFVCCECCVLSGKGFCDEPITRPEESYRLWCVVVCDQGTSRMRRPWPALVRSATKKNYCWWSEFLTVHLYNKINWLIAFRRIKAGIFAFGGGILCDADW